MNINKDLYNSAYSKFTPDYIQSDNISKINEYLSINSESLVNFVTKYLDQFDLSLAVRDRSCLELGSGLGSLSFYLSDQFNEYLGLDYSELAIAMARDIAKLKEEYLEYKVFDVCSEQGLDNTYDFIVDSHLFHCLTKKQDRLKYLIFVKNHLSQSGIYLLETMAFQPELQVPVGYSFNRNNILSKEIDGEELPIRAIFDSRTIEKEFEQAGLKINYLFFHNELSFNVFDDYKDYPTRFLPKTIRLSASLL